MTPTVSVLIPGWNCERYLEETVESVLAQSLQDFELRLHDDGSTDGTAALMTTLASRDPDRITVSSAPNEGVGAARNHLAAGARGEMLCFLDADDLLPPDALRLRVEALRAGADVAHCNYAEFRDDEDGRRFEAPSGSATADAHPEPDIALLTRIWAPPGAFLFRREVVEQIGGWLAELVVCQDVCFYFDAACAGARFVYLPEVGLHYRWHSESLSRTKGMAFTRDLLGLGAHAEEMWKPDLTPERRQALGHVYGLAARRSAEKDQTLFEEACARIKAVHPGYVPSAPAHLALATRLLGYRRAERLAVWYRKIRGRGSHD